MSCLVFQATGTVCSLHLVLDVFKDKMGFDLGGDLAKFLEAFASNNCTHSLLVFLKKVCSALDGHF